MKKNGINFILLLAIVVGITSCKKENLPLDENRIEAQTILAASKSWYNEVIIQAKSQGDFLTPVLGASKVNWDKEAVYKNANTIILNTDFTNKSFVKYLKINLDEMGEVKNESYLCIYFKDNNKINAENFKMNENFLNGKVDDIEFNGTILEYDLKYNLLSNINYKNGFINKNETNRIDYKVSKSSTQKVNTGSQEASRSCTAYYWVVTNTATGEVLSTTYLFSICGSDDQTINPDWDGGVGGGNPVDPCAEFNEFSQTFMNAGASVNGGSQYLGVPPTDSDNWTVPYNWIIFSAGPWGLVSYENASLIKVHYQNYSRWEFQTMVHTSIQSTGMNIGGTRTCTYVNSNFNMTSTHQTVWNRIDFKVTSNVAAVGNCTVLPPIEILYNANTTHYAP